VLLRVFTLRRHIDPPHHPPGKKVGQIFRVEVVLGTVREQLAQEGDEVHEHIIVYSRQLHSGRGGGEREREREREGERGGGQAQ
jgi:hypothetical protein